MHISLNNEIICVSAVAVGFTTLHRVKQEQNQRLSQPLSQSTLNSSLSAFLLGAKVFTLDKRGRHCEGLLLIRSSQSGGHGQLERVS